MNTTNEWNFILLWVLFNLGFRMALGVLNFILNYNLFHFIVHPHAMFLTFCLLGHTCWFK